MAIGACQWSGVAIVIASTSFFWRMLRKSLSVAGATHLFLCAVSKLLEDVAVYIADVANRRFLVCLERGKMSVGTPVEPDNGKIQAIVGAENLAIALCAVDPIANPAAPTASVSRNSRRVTMVLLITLRAPDRAAGNGDWNTIPAFLGLPPIPAKVTCYQWLSMRRVSRVDSFRKPGIMKVVWAACFLVSLALLLLPFVFRLDGKAHADWQQFLGRFRPVVDLLSA